MKFSNFKLKLVIIDRLMSLGYFEEPVKSLIAEHWNADDFDYEPIAEIEDYFRRLDLTDDQLAEIKSIEFDGGLDIYRKIIPNWDGEDDRFDIDSLIEIDSLPNLENIFVISMLTTTDIDPLLELNSLRKIRWSEIYNDAAKADRLRRRAVVVES